ncbi:hypothetical protein J7K93_04750 [bacterium]|nr:hypothetical protein [bacterium]
MKRWNKQVIVYLTLTVVLLFFSCSNKINKIVDFSDIFTQVDSLLMGDNDSISQPVDVARVDDSSFVFIDFWARSIFSLYKASGKIMRIGETGRGPGEYIWPDKLIANNDKIYFSDFQTRTIQKIDIQGKYYNKIIVDSPIRRFCIDKYNNYYILAPSKEQLRVYDKRGKLNKKLLPVNEKYKYPISKLHGGGICYDNNKYIYFANVIGAEIYKIKLDSSYIEKFSRISSPVYKKVPMKLQGDSYLNFDGPKRRKLLEQVTKIMNLYFIDTSKGYVAVYLKDGDNFNFIEIWDKDGKLLRVAIFSQSEYPIGCSNGEIFTIKERTIAGNEDKIEFWLNIYHINDITRK